MEQILAMGGGNYSVTINGVSIEGPSGMSWLRNLGSVINRFLPYIFAAAGFGLLIMIVMAGFGLLTSAGDPKKMEMGKQQLTNAIIGFVIVFLAYWIVQIAGYIFGVEEICTAFNFACP
jgi:hypothetical protein